MSLVPSPPLAPSDEQSSPWSPLVICIIASLGTVFVIFSYYTIIRIIRIELGARSFRNRVQRHLLNEAIIEYPLFQFQSHGLDDSTAQSLPIIQYLKNENQPCQNSKNTDCAVCLGEFQDGEKLKLLPKCSHSFHISCIDMWFMSHSNCPLCRTQVFELSISAECSVSMDSLLETLGREDYVHGHDQERDEHYHNLRSEILRNHAARTG